MSKVNSRGLSTIDLTSNLRRRKWIARTVLFSLVVSPLLPIVMNWVDSFAPRNQFGNHLLWLGSFSSGFVISSIMMILFAFAVALIVQRGLFERRKDGALRAPLVVRTGVSWLVLLVFGVLLMVGL